jgi:hypothetical protein
MSPRPHALPPRWDAIPEALRARNGWVLWRYEWRKDRWTKPPCRAAGHGYASTTDPKTWAGFETARVAAAKADGVGVVLTEDLVGIDLDHVVDPRSGEIQPWAAEVLERFRGCYVERSPGGDGLRIFCRGVVKHSGKAGPENRLEVYGRGSPRYLTVTGHRQGEGDVIEAQQALDWLHARFFERPTKQAASSPTMAAGEAGRALTDDEVLTRARNARNGAKFSRLWAGDQGADPSSADAALAGILSFWTQDRVQLDRLFRRSGLMRPKWDEMRGQTSYGDRTIRAVLANGGEQYSGPAAPSPGASLHPRELRPLPPELPKVEPFPIEALPDSLRPWVADVSERMQCPPDFVAVPMLVAAASVAARVAAIRLRQHDDWTEPGNLWALIVGRPGVMKSPAMRAALSPLEGLERRAVEVFNERVAEHRAEALAAKIRSDDAERRAREALKKDGGADVAHLLRAEDGPQIPTRHRYVVNSPTWEKLHSLLAENPGGLLMERDEMRGWFVSMSREENAEARSFWVKAWSGGAFTVDRVGRGTITAADMRVSIIGAIQPGPLAGVMQEARTAGGDDGLIERFLVAWPDDPGPWRDVDRLPDGQARLRLFEVFDYLDALTPEAIHAERDLTPDGAVHRMPFLRLDDGAHDLFREWRTSLEMRLRGTAEGEHEAALAKYRHHVPALALTLHLTDFGTGRVTERAMGRALALAEYFESHGRRLHSSGSQAVVRAARAVLAKLRAGALTEPFSARDVYRPKWACLADREVVAGALDLLVGHGWLYEMTMTTEGRPAEVYGLTEAGRHGQVD